jgi:hypothetical protein
VEKAVIFTKNVFSTDSSNRNGGRVRITGDSTIINLIINSDKTELTSQGRWR